MSVTDQRAEAILDRKLDALLAERIDFAPIKDPHALVKLRNILKKYRKSAHPFTECVKDNRSRFGPGRVEEVCATLKDTIVGNTHWRKGGKKKAALSLPADAKIAAVLAEYDAKRLLNHDFDCVVDGSILLALDKMSDGEVSQVFMAARALDEHGTTGAAALLDTTGADELRQWGDAA